MLTSRLFALVAVVCCALSTGCVLERGEGFGDDDDGAARPGGPETPGAPQGNGWCDSLTFVGDIEGLEAIARLSFEPAFERAYVGGTIDTPTANYTFFGDMPIDVDTKQPVSDVMWVEVNTTGSNERFRAEIRFHDVGFTFIANAYEGAYSTPYEFTCQR